MKRITMVSMLILCFFGLCNISFGAPITFSGNWTTPNVQGFPLTPPGSNGPFSATWEFSFDETLITGVSTMITLVNLPLSSFTWTGVNYGGFNQSNVGANLVSINNGVVTRILIGGITNGVSGFSGMTNDFVINYDPTNVGPTFYCIAAGNCGAGSSASTGGAQQNPQAPIPEPGTVFLFSTGLLGLAGYRWHQRRREGTQVG